MKKSHLYGIVVIGLAIVIIISTAGDASTYVGFGEAKQMALSGNDEKIHVVGQLATDSQGEVVGIEPSADKLSFSFQMVDLNQHQQQVFYKEPMPTDFLRSEQIVVIGSYHNDTFVADKILMKCPSKYQEQELEAEVVD